MKRPALALLVAIALTFAAPYTYAADRNSGTIRELYQKLMSIKGATEYTFDVSLDIASAEPLNVQIHLDAMGQPGKDRQDILNAKAVVHVTVDGSQGKNSFHGAGEVRVVGGNLYMQLSKLDYDAPSSNLQTIKTRYVGKWYQLSLKDAVSQGVPVQNIEEEVAKLAEIFQVRARVSSRSTRYVISLKPSVISKMLGKTTPGSETTIQFNGLAEFTPADVFQKMAMMFNAQTKTTTSPSLFSGPVIQNSKKPVNATGSASFRMKQIASVTVQAPATYTSIQDEVKGLQNLSPSSQINQVRDAQRRADINTILNACYLYSIDHNNAFPANIPDSPVPICASGKVCDGVKLQNATYYLTTVPVDPSLDRTSKVTGYMIQLKNGHLIVTAPLAEVYKPMSVTR